MSTKEFVVTLDTTLICPLHSLWPRCCQHPEARGLDCEGDLNRRPYLCPLKEHSIGECAEKHKEEGEEYFAEATKRVGW